MRLPRPKLSKRWLLLTLIANLAAAARFITSFRSRTHFGPLPNIEPITSPWTGVTGNVALYIGNIAFQPSIVDIHVEIDGRSVVHGAFEHDLQTKYTRYLIDLSPGEHRLKAETQRGQAALEEVFLLESEIHIAVSYYYGEPGLLNGETRTLTFHAEDQPWIPDWACRPGR